MVQEMSRIYSHTHTPPLLKGLVHWPNHSWTHKSDNQCLLSTYHVPTRIPHDSIDPHNNRVRWAYHYRVHLLMGNWGTRHKVTSPRLRALKMWKPPYPTVSQDQTTSVFPPGDLREPHLQSSQACLVSAGGRHPMAPHVLRSTHKPLPEGGRFPSRMRQRRTRPGGQCAQGRRHRPHAHASHKAQDLSHWIWCQAAMLVASQSLSQAGRAPQLFLKAVCLDSQPGSISPMSLPSLPQVSASPWEGSSHISSRLYRTASLR